MQAVNQMNVQGRQIRQGMQEMERDRQRRDSGTRRDGDKPRCSWKNRRRGAGGTEAAEGWRDKRGELQGATQGESWAQGHKQGGREGAGRARARRFGAEGRANEAEGERVSWAARCLCRAGGQAGCAEGQARAAGETARGQAGGKRRWAGGQPGREGRLTEVKQGD